MEVRKESAQRLDVNVTEGVDLIEREALCDSRYAQDDGHYCQRENHDQRTPLPCRGHAVAPAAHCSPPRKKRLRGGSARVHKPEDTAVATASRPDAGEARGGRCR